MDYPPSLPVFYVDGYCYSDDDDMFRTEMEAGPARQRRMARSTMTVFNVQTKMTSGQLSIFEAWYASDADFGTSWFYMYLYVGLGLIQHKSRFRNHPEIRKRGQRAWLVSCKIEVESRATLVEDSYSDIVFWDGFEGVVTDGVYTAPATSWPASHSYPVPSDGVIDSTAGMIGQKALVVSTIADQISIPVPEISAEKGRIGFKWKVASDPSGKPIITLTKAM